MDIGSHRPSLASRTTSETLSLAASSTVYTYHCLCAHLLVATTTPLPSLPTRQNSVDKAHIMPLPPAPATKSTKPNDDQPMDHYGLMLSTAIDRNAEIVQSESGFEKRWLQRCGRCNLVVGYQLDWQQFDGEGRNGRREDLVFLLPGGFVTTSEMVMGKMAADAGLVVGVKEIKV